MQKTDYTEITFSNISSNVRDMLPALLAEEGFEGFEETDTMLKAYIPAEQYKQDLVASLAARFGVAFSTAILPGQNWNQVWESNFEPVYIEQFCTIRAAFHAPAENVEHEIIITPKMSFGTGHHATTFMMISAMKNIPFANKKVLDFGTGTGVLAILALQRGAKDVLAIDNDEWSIENAKENFNNNNAARIRLLKVDSAATGESFDVILANITRNVIGDNFQFFSDALSPGGILLLSGLMEEDEHYISGLASARRLQPFIRQQRDKWLCIGFSQI